MKDIDNRQFLLQHGLCISDPISSIRIICFKNIELSWVQKERNRLHNILIKRKSIVNLFIRIVLYVILVLILGVGDFFLILFIDPYMQGVEILCGFCIGMLDIFLFTLIDYGFIREFFHIDTFFMRVRNINGKRVVK